MRARWSAVVAGLFCVATCGCSSSDAGSEVAPPAAGGAIGTGGAAGAQAGGGAGAAGNAAGAAGGSANGGGGGGGGGGGTGGAGGVGGAGGSAGIGGVSGSGGTAGAGGVAAGGGGNGGNGGAGGTGGASMSDAGDASAKPDGSSGADADAAISLPPPNADVIAIMKKVADWQIGKLGTTHANGWVEGAMWAGMLALYGVSKDAKYLDATKTWAGANNWQLLNAPTTNADNQCAAQSYFELYLLDPTPQNMTLMVANAKVSFDAMVTANTAGWTWVDALFMSPPGVARLYAITQDAKYLTFLHAQWLKTKGTLFSATDGLWWRDPPPSVASGNPRDIFWSRGNGWVMAASARVLEYVPQSDPQRDIYVQNIKTMAAALAPIQQPDGLWRSDLLHPNAYPNPESSGTGFFAYAIAWGINHGILDRASYQTVAVNAWKGLVTCVAADGLFGYVQPPGWQPGAATATQTSAYGVGAFLLAGSEIARL